MGFSRCILATSGNYWGCSRCFHDSSGSSGVLEIIFMIVMESFHDSGEKYCGI